MVHLPSPHTETPLYIWANFELDESELGSIGMPFVVPTLLKVAGVPLSGYYEYMLDVNRDVPIQLSSCELRVPIN